MARNHGVLTQRVDKPALVSGYDACLAGAPLAT